jgi:hypothetical protein
MGSDDLTHYYAYVETAATGKQYIRSEPPVPLPDGEMPPPHGGPSV